MHASTNNSAAGARVFVLSQTRHNRGADDSELVALTTEPRLFAEAHPGPRRLCKPTPTPAAIRRRNSGAGNSAVDNDEKEALNSILHSLLTDAEFNQKYHYSSLFLIGGGAYGRVFRVVSRASGRLANPQYDERYVSFLQTLRRTRSRKRADLLDHFRDRLCLDLVAIKVEALTKNDVSFQAANRIQLVKEFIILTELFKTGTSVNSLVGFPLPIEFGFLGSTPIAKNLRSVLIFDTHGHPNNYLEAIVKSNSVLNLRPGVVTNVSYMAMELLGPNLEELKQFFASNDEHPERKVFTVQTTLKLMDQLLCRLLVMHQRNMVHLDLKPDNLCIGIGKMTNTVYLVDFGLSRICSDERPTITMGSRRYMSIGVLNLWPTNFMMDLESWFYVLVVMLTDYVPWSDEVLNIENNGLSKDSNGEARIQQTALLKKQFWGEDISQDTKVFQQVLQKALQYHGAEVPDIVAILNDIYAHIRRMRQDFYRVSAATMHSDIRNDQSDLYKRYHILRKLLLFPYDCDFCQPGTCFARDKDLARLQDIRRRRHSMLIYAESGKNWHWDWDVWFEQDHLGLDDQGETEVKPWLPTAGNAVALSQQRTSQEEGGQSRFSEEDDYAEEAQAATSSSSIPGWMRHYLARVMDARESESTGAAESSTESEGELIAAVS